MRLRPLTLLMAALLLLAGHGGASPAPASAPSVPPAKSTLLRDDPLLQERITLEATDRPLGEVLKDLSTRLKVDLIASRQVADQRVTLRLSGQPLHLLMNRLPALLSHAPDHPLGYYWERLARPAKARPAFSLWRDLRSVQDEERELDYPRREAAVLLRDLRNLSRLRPEDHAKYKGDFPHTLFGSDPADPLAAALKDLSDEQLDALLGGATIPLDPARFAGFLAADRQAQRDRWKGDRALATLDGRPDPYPDGFPAQPEVAPTLSVSPGDQDGRNPNARGLYHFSIAGINGDTVIDVYDTNRSPSPDREPSLFSKPPPGLVVDLTPLLTDKAVTPEQRADLGFTLQALAKAARVNLYQEAFFKSGSTGFYRSNGLTTLKGTLPQLTAAICAEWNCHAEKVGGDYLFWSRTWAWDRSVDIPDRLLAPWKARFQRQGGLTLADDAEIAAALTWPQVSLTLNIALPDSGPWDQKEHYEALRLIGSLSPLERDAASSADGLPLASLSPEAGWALADCFPRGLAGASGDSLAQAVLRVETPPPGCTERMVGVNVCAAGKTLFGTLMVTDPPPAPAPAAPSRP